MDFLFFFIFLISFILLILGLIKPSIGLFWSKQQASRKGVLLIYGIAIVCSFIGIGIFAKPSTSPSKESTEKVVERDAPKKASDDELVMKYETKWETTTLRNDGDFPLYKDYAQALTLTLEEMSSHLQSDSLPKLRKLHTKLFNSKKYVEALENFNLYGQPDDAELYAPCEEYLAEAAKDPSSVKIEKRKIEGRTKHGWEVWLKYSAVNSFGARISQVSKFDVRHGDGGSFYVHRVY